MATVRTLDQLVALWIDNDVGAITAGDGRDFIASTFGFFSTTRNPGPHDDKVNTSGVGAYFDTGSKWLNLVTGQPALCLDGTAGAAVWVRLAFDGEAAGGRLTGTWPTPVLTATGVTPGPYGDISHYATLVVQADGTITAAASFPLPTFSGVVQVLPGHYMSIGGSTAFPVVDWVGPLVASDIPNLDATILTSGLLNDSRLTNTAVTPGSYGDSTHVGTFTVDAHGRLTAAASVAISAGTVTSVGLSLPAEFSVSGSPVSGSGTLAGTWQTQAANKVFAGPASGGAATPTFRLLVAADVPSLDAGKITTGTFSTSQIPALDAAKITTGTFAVGLIPGLPGSIITSGTIGSSFLPAGSALYGTISAFPQVKKFTKTFSDVQAAGAGVHQFTLATLLTLPARAFIGRISWYIATAFSGTGITTIVLNLGFNGGAGGTSLDTFYLNSGAMNSVSARPTALSNTQDCQNATATWQFTWGVNANIAANLSNCTAGSLDITVEYWQPT